MTTLQKTMVAVTVATLAGAGIYEARQASQLRAQNQALQQAPSVDQAQDLKNSGDDAANSLASLREENEQLKSNQNELLKLRGEVDGFRQQAADAEKRATAAEQKLAAMTSAASLFKANEAITVNGAKQLSLGLIMFADNHDNQFPTPSQFVQERREGGSLNLGGMEVGVLEYFNPGAGWREHPNTVVLRERIAKQASDGTWERIYAFADGSVQKALSNDGNFEAWEKVNTYAPPPVQNQ